MAKTYRKKNMGSTRKNRNSSLGLKSFQKEVTVIFLEMLLLVKLFHWKTYSYATHKATDELYESLNGHIDNFIEILMGKSGSRIDLMSQKTIKLEDLQSKEKLRSKINSFKGYLVSFENKASLKTMSNSDLYNVRDEILGDLNKFLYLLTLE
jgi:DNA-binding ferritin-like protein